MDVFKFNNPTHPMLMEQGEIVNGLSSKMWIERYSEAGEFTFSAPVSSNIRETLPIGTFVSHINTRDIMRVKDHEINEEKNQEAELIVTGVGLEVAFDSRIVGAEKTFPTSTGVTDYVMSSAFLDANIVTLIKDHIYASEVVDADNAIPYLEVISTVSSHGTAAALSLRQTDLYSAVLELLIDQDLGIRAVRPGPWNTALSNLINTAIEVHQGADRTQTVVFSNDSGEIERADYLWSDRKDKNCALITGRWVETTVEGTEVGIDRKWMTVDASDIDQSLTSAPSGGTLTSIVNKMKKRGTAALRAQKNIALTKAEIAKNSVRALYRTDYELGDLISVEGNYNEDSIRRVTEYVEIEDKTGRSGYPTLSEP